MKVERLEDFLVWQRGQELARRIYALFAKNRDYSFRDQIQRAAVSIRNNIAEGYERRSNAEFKQFLYIAKGSCGEVRSMAHLAGSLGHLQGGDAMALVGSSGELSRMLSALIKKL